MGARGAEAPPDFEVLMDSGGIDDQFMGVSIIIIIRKTAHAPVFPT